MSTPNDTRLVPITREQRDRLHAWFALNVCSEIVAAWDAAPAADPGGRAAPPPTTTTTP